MYICLMKFPAKFSFPCVFDSAIVFAGFFWKHSSGYAHFDVGTYKTNFEKGDYYYIFFSFIFVDFSVNWAPISMIILVCLGKLGNGPRVVPEKLLLPGITWIRGFLKRQFIFFFHCFFLWLYWMLTTTYQIPNMFTIIG